MDSDTQSIEEFSGIEQPPLLEQIKRILDEYRNDVQIIKELIQNADDAEATAMSILYEGRTINPERDDESEYCKFLRAPALVFYNDKTFTNDDWRGIRSIYTSVKRDDPLKIGRFGLGFKSVFHLTDYPCIISGENALFINPHAKEFGRICVMVKLKNLKAWHRLNKNDYINSLFDTFLFGEDTLTSGHYNGTMFWFPLRQFPSTLSENTYPEENVYNLLHAFISESDRSLLFLKTLCSIKLFVDIPTQDTMETVSSKISNPPLSLMNFGKETPCFAVDVSSKSNDIQGKRKAFLNDLLEIGNEVPEVSKQWVFDITIRKLTNTILEEESKVAKSRWLIVNYLKGGEISEKLGLLMKDKDLGYPHIVGLAASIDEDSNFTSTSGHVFCYQPLPQENVCMTGLPVHVNGFFALSQNRRHVRWPDQGDTTHGQGDKKIEWNMELVSQILPESYERLLIELVNLCKKEGNPEYLLKAVYKAMPDLSVVSEHWHSLANRVPELCKDRSIFYIIQGGGIWIQAQDAVFVNMGKCETHTDNTDEYTSTIFDLLISDKINAIVVPHHVSDAFDQTGSRLRYATPEYLKSHMALSHHDTYKSLDLDNKQDLFEFVMLDSTTEGLDGLELLPLADGTFRTFNGSRVLLEGKDIVDLFPGQESYFVHTNLREKTRDFLTDLVEKGGHCLKALCDDSAVTMVTNVLNINFGPGEKIQVDNSECKKWANWVRNIWCLIQSRFRDTIQKFINCSIFPIVKTFDWENVSDIILTKLSTKILHLPSFSQLDDKTMIKQSLHLLSVSVIEHIPNYIDTGLISSFLHDETSEGITSLLDRITSEETNKFNNEVSDECSASLLKFLSERIHTTIRKIGKQILRNMRLFRGFKTQTQSDLVSLRETDNIYAGKTFPVDFPAKIIILVSNEEKSLVERLDANFVSEIVLVRKTMRNINEYDPHEKQKFAFWIITNGEHFKHHDVQEALKDIDFLESHAGLFYRPGELFDPSEDILRDLFNGESIFANVTIKNEQKLLLIDGLKQLGLKSVQNLSSENIYHVCDVVHKMTEENANVDIPKCKALLSVMNKHSNLLRKEALQNKRCIIIEDKLDDIYSKDIPLKNRQNEVPDAEALILTPNEIHSAKYVSLIGSVMFIIDCKHLLSLADVFDWTSQPNVSCVLQHFNNIIRHYQPQFKALYLPIVISIYDWLSKQDEMGKDDLKDMINDRFSKPRNPFVWDGSTFQPIENMYIESTKGDVDLKPFFHPLPSELQHFVDFFLQFGCQQSIGFDTYVDILQEIRESEQQTIDNKDLEETFTAMAIAILNRIKKSHFDDCINSEKELYFPTVLDNGGIQMMTAASCTFCDEQWLKNMDFQFDGDIKYIHPDLPISTAEALGVPSLRKQIMSDTEAFAEWGQEEPLTRRLRNLLKEGYVDGFSVAKELFQNADDAEAKTIHILYDERENNDAKTGLISDKMAECQGPAIWIHNDALFTESDFKNITILSGATKQDDSTKIGKFGLGFCAVYNITDVPSFISGESIVFFDPDMSHLGNVLPGRSPGLRVNFRKLSNLKMLKSLRNQFKPFEGVFDCKILDTTAPYFNGTLFRLPLRNKASDISDVVYTPKEVKGLFEKIMPMAANMLLFNQNVVDFKLLHIPKTEYDLKNPKLLFEAHKNATRLCASDDEGFKALSMLVEASKRKQANSLLESPLQVIDRISVNIYTCVDSKFDIHVEERGITEDWLISWSTGKEEKSVTLSYDEKGSLPLGAVAIPLNHTNDSNVHLTPLETISEYFYQIGHLFFFLPLPIQHKFPFHINSQFTMTSDRRQLRTSTEDDKNVKMTQWNRYILEDSVVQALLFLLARVHEYVSTDEYDFTQFWPMHESADVLEYLPISFYQNVVKPGAYNIFEKNGQWFDISRCVFVERSLRVSKIGDMVFEVLSMLNKLVVDVPDNLYHMLSKADPSLIEQRTVETEAFFLEYLFPNFEDLSSEPDLNEKKKLLLYHAVDLQSEKLNDWLKRNKCIPSQPRGFFKRPCELIDSNSTLAEMFVAADSLFPESPFNDEQLSIKLRNLGLMFNVLPDDIIINRALSIKTLCKNCLSCACERSAHIINYLKDNIRNHESIYSDLKKIEFVPVRGKQKDWAFVWHADKFLCDRSIMKCVRHQADNKHYKTLFFDCPLHVYFSNCKNIVGCVAYLFDDTCCVLDKTSKVMLEQIGMKGIKKTNVPVDVVVHNLLTVATSYVEVAHDKPVSSLTPILHDIYQYLDDVCKTEKANVVAKLVKDKPVVYVAKQFVIPSLISHNCYSNCMPYLFWLTNSPLKEFPSFCKCLNIIDYFDPHFLALVIQKFKVDKKDNSLSSADIRAIIALLQCLQDSILHFDGDSLDVQSIVKGELEAIYGPDENGILQDCSKMCFNDYDDIEKTNSMIYVHESFPPNLAKFVGVNPKMIHSLEESSEDFEDDFFQHEPLITRLKNLIEGYPCDSGILKELIQNADDAEATEIHFLKDYVTHPKDYIIDPMFELLQGPALVVFNDSAFSKDDLNGIKSLGRGNKSDDPSKTGRYGVGFNAVYNLTDAPSFYTRGGNIANGETLCIFDPLARYVPKVTKQRPGKRYKDLRTIRKRHQDMMSGYHEEELITGTHGTVFRFPLRTQEMAESSEIKNESISIDTVSEILEEFSQDLHSVLIFLKHLKKVKISSYKDNHIVKEFEINIEMNETENQNRKEYAKKHKQMCEQFNKSKKSIFQFKQFCKIYKQTINARRGETSQTLHYVVVQVIGFNNVTDLDPLIKDSITSGKLGLLPHGGVALLTKQSIHSSDEYVWETSNSCKAFCFLPLPIETGMPVHVHGYFALDHETRRSLWRSEKSCYRTLWNESLLSDVVSVAYISLLKYAKTVQFQHITEKTTTPSDVMFAVMNYQRLFPVKDKLSDNYWKHLMVSIYKRLVDDYVEFLPVIATTLDNDIPYKHMVHLTWTSLKVPGSRFPAYIRRVTQKEDYKNYQNNILRRIGMRIVYVSEEIKQAMDISCVCIENLKPMHVIDFVCKSDIDDTECTIETERHIMHTSLQTVADATVVLSYCQGDTDKLISNIEYMPLFVTGDNIVHILPVQGFFLFETREEFCDFFPSRRSKFLHSSIARTFERTFRNMENTFPSKLRRFTLLEFVSLVKETKQIEDNCILFKPWSIFHPTKEWVLTFWKYFIYKLPEKTSEVVRQQLHIMWNIPLIPMSLSQSDELYLAPPCNMKRMLDIESFISNRDIYTTFQNMSIPHIHENTFNESENSEIMRAFEILSSHVPNYKKPREVLEGLYINIQENTIGNFPNIDAICILQYFNDALDDKTPSNHLSTLNKIPLFLSHFEERVILQNYGTKFVVPIGLPTEGLQDLAEAVGVLLLRNTGHKKVFKHLNIEKLSLIQVYIRIIIPHHSRMRREYFYEHIEYLSRTIFRYSNYNHCQDSDLCLLLSLLSKTKFVEMQNGSFVRVCDLFDPDHCIFGKMCKDDELVPIMLPDRVKQSHILSFFRRIGLKTKMTVSLFERFAKQISSKMDNEEISEEVYKLSFTLTTHLLSMDNEFFKNESFESIAKIKFVKPHVVDEEVSSIKQQFTSTKLICFEGSVLSCKEHIAWTVLNILPFHASPCRDIVLQKMKICRTPSLDDIVSHCELIGEEINKVIAKLSPRSLSKLCCIMNDIYVSLEGFPNNDTTNTKFIRLAHIPMVLFPKLKIVVPAKRVVITCKTEEEIPPYLLTATTYLCTHKDLLIRLGASQFPSCDSFACVLSTLKEQTMEAGGLELHPQEQSNAIKAMRHFLKNLANANGIINITGNELFLLSEKRTIVKSSMLVISDNVYFRNAIDKSTGNKCIFLIKVTEVFEENVKSDYFIEHLHKMPLYHRPHLLTDVVMERIILDHIETKNGKESILLNAFIHDNRFLYGFLRLYRHTLDQKEIKWKQKNEIFFADSLKSISFVQCSGIETELYIKTFENGKLGREVLIENSKELRYIHTEKSGDNVILYFDTADSKWMMNIRKEITIYLNTFASKCEGNFDAEASFNLSEIVGMFEKPQDIEIFLSQQRIKEYVFDIDISEASPSNPIPGDIVPERFHRYLDNGYGFIYNFDFKFIALEVDDPSFDEELEEECSDNEQENVEQSMPTYKYVHIIRKLDPENEIPLLQEYEIDCGTGTTQIVKGFQLYKFVRNKNHSAECGTDIVVFTGNTYEPSEESLPKAADRTHLSFKEACKEIRKILTEAWKKEEHIRKRIVKRLMLKWHPDKNPDNIHFCTKVFQYLQQCLHRLENGQNLKEEEDGEDSNTTRSNFSSHSSGYYWSNTGSYGNTRYDRYWNSYDRWRRYNESRYHESRYSGTSHGTGSFYYGGNFQSYWRSRSSYTHASYEPYHWYSMARVWYKQAEFDLKQARDIMEYSANPQYNWSCYCAHQAAEKALKAAWYSKDAKKIDGVGKSHNLKILARDLDSQIQVLANDMSSLTGEYSSMRYPQTWGRPQLPSEIYTRTTAARMIKLAEQIITLVQESYIR